MLVKATAATAAAAVKQPTTSKRGAFIVLEGVDRCGKTTQSKLLLQRLLTAGLAACSMRFPNRSTATGRIINEYLTTTSSSSAEVAQLDDCAIHLLFSANRWEAKHEILECLANGTTIVCDRYAHSGVAFSSSKNDLSVEWCRAPDQGLPAPDCVIFLQLSADDAEARGGYGGERYEKRDMQERVRERFDELYQLDLEAQQQQKNDDADSDGSDDNGVVIPQWAFVDAAQSVEQVQADVWKAVQETIHRVQDEDKPVGKMFAPGTLELPATTKTGDDDYLLTATAGSDDENQEPTDAAEEGTVKDE